jgi:hypothetical protein
MGQEDDNKDSIYFTIAKSELPAPSMQDDSKCSVFHFLGFYALFLAMIGGGILVATMLKNVL